MNEYDNHFNQINSNNEVVKLFLNCSFCNQYMEVCYLNGHKLTISEKVCRNCQSNKNIEYTFLLEQEKKHEIFNRVRLPNKPLTSKEVESAVNIGELKMIREQLNKEFSIDFIPEWIVEKEINIKKNIKLKVKLLWISTIVISLCLLFNYHIPQISFIYFLFVVGFLNYRFNDFNDAD